MKTITLIFLALISISTYSEESKPVPTKAGLYDIGEFSLYLECYENDKPALILEQGFGRWGSDGVWLENIKRLQDQFSICLYDRSGLGKSEKGPVPFTVNDTANRLHKLLDTAGIKPPYYLAGGSYAYYIIKAFNNLYPKDVLGAVLIDPPPFGQFYVMGTRWPEEFKTDNEELKKYMDFDLTVHNPFAPRVPENVDHMKSYQQLVNAADFGDKSVIVVRAKQSGKRQDPPFVPDDIAAPFEALFINAEKNFKALSTNSSVIYSESPRHHLHIADRDLVVKSIKAMVNE